MMMALSVRMTISASTVFLKRLSMHIHVASHKRVAFRFLRPLPIASATSVTMTETAPGLCIFVSRSSQSIGRK